MSEFKKDEGPAFEVRKGMFHNRRLDIPERS